MVVFHSFSPGPAATAAKLTVKGSAPEAVKVGSLALVMDKNTSAEAPDCTEAVIRAEAGAAIATIATTTTRMNRRLT